MSFDRLDISKLKYQTIKYNDSMKLRLYARPSIFKNPGGGNYIFNDIDYLSVNMFSIYILTIFIKSCLLYIYNH